MSAIEVVTSRFGRAFRELRHFPTAWRLVWEAASRWTIAWTALLVIQGLLPLATVLLIRFLVDAGAAAVRAGASWEQLRPALLAALAIAGVALLSEILRGLASYVRTAQSLLVRDYIAGLIHEKSLQVGLEFYDSPAFYDRLHRARDNGGERPLALIESLGSLLQNLVTFVAMAAVLLSFGALPLAALAVAILPVLYVVLRVGLREYEWRLANTERERRTYYYDWLITDHDAAAELRSFGLGNHFRYAFQSARAKLRESRMQLASKQFGAEVAARISALAIAAAALGWMIWRTVQGHVSLGALAMFYQAFTQATGVVRTSLENVAAIHRNTLYLGDLMEFLALEAAIKPAGQALTNAAAYDIEFRDVAFGYPATDRDVLRGVNLHVRAGTIAAIVGPNGSGKSTLLKLLCRFYDPQRGAVLINGTPLTHWNPESLRTLISVAFQGGVHYAESAGENIRLGELGAGRDMAPAAEAAGADEIVTKLPNGYDTLLSRWFTDGAELSTGEWQRIGLSRAFYRNAPIMILDEPTSAMDPWAEAHWIRSLREFTRGRTVLIITHRFSTARFADLICVMAEGKVAEAGTHEQLIAQDGLYAKAWHAGSDTNA